MNTFSPNESPITHCDPPSRPFTGNEIELATPSFNFAPTTPLFFFVSKLLNKPIK